MSGLANQIARCIQVQFQDYQTQFDLITRRAPQRFLCRQWRQLQADTAKRLELYAKVVDQTESAVRNIDTRHTGDDDLWGMAKAAYARCIAPQADRELAETFFNSVTRRIFTTVGVNPRIEFIHGDEDDGELQKQAPNVTPYRLQGPIEPVIRQILSDYSNIHFDPKVLARTLPEMAARIDDRLTQFTREGAPTCIEMLPHLFYRGQGAYAIGRITVNSTVIPLVIALLHPPEGMVVDGLLLDTDGVSIVFSFTRSAFHVVTEQPAALVQFLHSIIPAKPRAELYSAIGYFKHGKSVLYRNVCQYTAQCQEKQFRIAPGKPGMVMVVFNLADHHMVVKLIRDRFANPKQTTRNKVMAQYDFVFNHYRVGRLIEAHAFEHLSFDRCWFSDELLHILTTEAGQTVHLEGDQVIFDHAYLERRVTPLDIYLQQAHGARADAAAVDFGHAIKDLVYANIFPGDMLLKNFGVTRHGRVVFYDYDEIVPLTACRFRKIPEPRNPIEEMADEPWYMVEENDVFPEEFARFLGLSPPQRDLFLHHHADLLTPDFWVKAQEEIRRGQIRHIRPYHHRYRLPG